MKTQKIWFITGASKGLGFEITKAVLAAGDKVVGTVRTKPEQLSKALNNNPDLHVVLLDVTNEEQTRSATQQAISKFGRIDVLVNNAGYGLLTAVEEASDAEVRKQYDTNVFGLLNVTRAVVPYFRKQGSGHIINISSVLGFNTLSGLAIYGSTKFAVEGITEGLALELAPLGIHATAVEPGLFRTNFLDESSYFESKNVISDYAATVGELRKNAKHLHGNQPGDPAKLGKALVKLVYTEKPPVHLMLGKDTLAMYKAKAEQRESEIAVWEEVTTGTDFEKVEEAVA